MLYDKQHQPESYVIKKWIQEKQVMITYVLRSHVHSIVILHDESYYSHGNHKDDSEKDNTCAVCLENVDSDDLTLNCGHVFHISCVMALAQCPLCRMPII